MYFSAEFSRQHNSETTSKRLRIVFGTADTLTSESLTTTAEGTFILFGSEEVKVV